MAGSADGTGSLRPWLESGYSDGGDKAVGTEWLLYDPGRWTWKDAEADETQVTGDEDAPDDDRRPGRSRDRYQEVRGSFDPANLTFGLELGESRKRMTLWPTRKRCPACQNSGPRPVVTRVSLGTSAAVKVLSEGLMEALPTHASDAKKRLLVFCDSRQDAAHQARFIAYARRYDRMRTRAVELLKTKGPQSIQKLVEGLARLGFDRKDNPLLPKIGQPKGETLEKVRAWEEAPLLDDLAINPRYRATLENLGLIRVVYEGIEELIAAHGAELAPALKVPAEHQPYVIARFLDTLRRMGALRRPLLAYHPLGVSFPEVLREAQWERRLMNPVGLPKGPNDYPALRCEPGTIPKGITAKQVWSHIGFRTSGQKVLLQFAQRYGGADPEQEGVARLLDLLAENSLLAPVRLHGFKGDIELYQVSDDCLVLDLTVEERRQRCGVCSLVVPDHPRVSRAPAAPGRFDPSAMMRSSGRAMPAGRSIRRPRRWTPRSTPLRCRSTSARRSRRRSRPRTSRRMCWPVRPHWRWASMSVGSTRLCCGTSRRAPTTTPSAAAGQDGAAGWAWSSATPGPRRTTSTSSTTPPR
jgi:hypothetical protein